MMELHQRMLDATVQRSFAVLSQDGKWQTLERKPDFLFPVHALSKVFRGKFLGALAQGHKSEPLGRDPQGDDSAWRERQRRAQPIQQGQLLCAGVHHEDAGQAQGSKI